jgi:glycosyltransferase involved in cell wall biosynthesis
LHVGRPRRGENLVAHLDADDLDRMVTSWLLGYLGSSVDAFIAPDAADQQRLLTLGVAPERIHIIGPAVPTGRDPTADRAERRARLGLAAGDKVIAAAGPLVRRKAFDETIWCFELIRVLYPEARLLIFGDGADRGRLERFADEVSDPGCVRFLGYRADIADLLPCADVYWQLDAPRTTPLALLEAQAAAVPVVVSNLPPHRTAMQADQTGLVVPLGNRAAVARATDDLFRDAALSQRMGAAGAALARTRWGIEPALAAYAQLYAAVLRP